MPEYDSTLKKLIQSGAQVTEYRLTGTAVRDWLNIEIQRGQALRVDLLGQPANGELVHIWQAD